MATYTRSSVWNNGGTFDNDDLKWYAQGVGAMQAKALNDPNSWWFFGAMHGQYVTQESITKFHPPLPWSQIPGPPKVPTTPLPAQSVVQQFWDQCQHGTWYFPPWHRGYLIALEAQIRAQVIRLGGPSSWALPYWNYLGPDPQFNLPPAFRQQTFNGGPNPLYVAARYGPEDTPQTAWFVPTQVWQTENPGNKQFKAYLVTDASMANHTYIGSYPTGFGGPQTGFSYRGVKQHGGLEHNPHDFLHGYVGGNVNPNSQVPGLMSDPGLAALDPIFYLHHAEIDRLWAGWDAAGNQNPTVPNWKNGPAASGQREFVMPMPDGTQWVFKPSDLSSLTQVNYTYDSLPQLPSAPNQLKQRLISLGAISPGAPAGEGVPVTPGENAELVGASEAPLPVKGSAARTPVKLHPEVRRKVSASLANASVTSPPDRVFLHLENVRGTGDANALAVYLNLPEGADPADHPELLAGSFGLFGLHAASAEAGEEGGQGLNFTMDISRQIDALHVANALDTDAIHVTIVPRRPVPDQAPITVGRVSVYRHGR